MNDHWQALLTLTQTMLAYCESNNWQSLLECERNRQELITNIKLSDSKHNMTDAPIIQELLAIEQKILETVEKNKADTTQELIELRRTLKKSDGYQT